MNKPRVDKSLEWDFIKVILIKNQGRSKRDKKQMQIGKSRYIELDKAYCCTKKFNMALSLCRVLMVALYFSKGFSEIATGVLAVAEAPQPLEVMESNLWFPVS